MVDVAKKKFASQFSNGLELMRGFYDFSVDGGAVDVYDLVEMDQDIVIVQAWCSVKELFTSGGAPTVEVGVKGGDTDAILPATALGSLTNGALFDGDAASERLKVVDGGILSMEIKVAAVTAGKLELALLYAKF